jgi:hypothetical protein
MRPRDGKVPGTVLDPLARGTLTDIIELTMLGLGPACQFRQRKILYTHKSLVR